MRHIAWTLLVGAGVACVASALAQPPDGGQGPPEGRPGFPVSPLMAALDTDQDGEISAKEMRRATAALKSLDIDGNGKLTENELRPQFPGGAGGGPPGPGGRGPGGPGGPPSAEEFVKRALEFDADKDGKLSREELAKMGEQLARRPPFGGPRGGPGGQGPQRPGIN